MMQRRHFLTALAAGIAAAAFAHGQAAEAAPLASAEVAPSAEPLEMLSPPRPGAAVHRRPARRHARPAVHRRRHRRVRRHRAARHRG